MSYEIVYDRRFISVGEHFIPLFQYGSNNSFEIGRTGCEIPSKNWGIVQGEFKNKILLSKEEIEIASKYYSDSEFFRTRNKPFEKGEFTKWYVGGVKKAQTIEYYNENGNSFSAVITGPNNYHKYYSIRTTNDLLDAINKFEFVTTFDTHSYHFRLQFDDRKVSLPKRPRVIKQKKKYPHYFVLKCPVGYFVRKTARGYKYCYYDSYSAKKFKTEKEIEKFFEKYPSYASEFTVEKVEKEISL